MSFEAITRYNFQPEIDSNLLSGFTFGTSFDNTGAGFVQQVLTPTLRASVEEALNNTTLNTGEGLVLKNILIEKEAQIVLAYSPGSVYKNVPEKLQGNAPSTTIGKTSMVFYEDNNKNTSTNQQIKDNLLHELGHLLDDLLGENTINPTTGKRNQFLNQDVYLSKLLQKAYDGMDASTQAKYNGAVPLVNGSRTVLTPEIVAMILSSKLGATNVPNGYAKDGTNLVAPSTVVSDWGDASTYILDKLAEAVINKKWGEFTNLRVGI